MLRSFCDDVVEVLMIECFVATGLRSVDVGVELKIGKRTQREQTHLYESTFLAHYITNFGDTIIGSAVLQL